MYSLHAGRLIRFSTRLVFLPLHTGGTKGVMPDQIALVNDATIYRGDTKFVGGSSLKQVAY